MYLLRVLIAATLIGAPFLCSSALGQLDCRWHLPNPSHGFEMMEIVFQPQHTNVDDGVFKARVTFVAHSVPDRVGIAFDVEMANVRSIDEVNKKIGYEVVKKVDSIIKGWQADKDAFEKSGMNAFGDICASAPNDPGCHSVQQKPAPRRPEDEETAVPKNGYAIQYIALTPKIRGVIDGHYHAQVSVTALSMPQFWDRKLLFELNDVQSIEEIKRQLPSLIDKEADDTIAKLSKDRDAFEKPATAKPQRFQRW